MVRSWHVLLKKKKKVNNVQLSQGCGNAGKALSD